MAESNRIELGQWKLRKDQHRYDRTLFTAPPPPKEEGSARFQKKDVEMYSRGELTRQRELRVPEVQWSPTTDPRPGAHWVAAIITPAEAVLDARDFLDCNYGKTLSHVLASGLQHSASVSTSLLQSSVPSASLSHHFTRQFDQSNLPVHPQHHVKVFIQFEDAAVAADVIHQRSMEIHIRKKTEETVKDAPSVPSPTLDIVTIRVASCTDPAFLEKLQRLEALSRKEGSTPSTVSDDSTSGGSSEKSRSPPARQPTRSTESDSTGVQGSLSSSPSNPKQKRPAPFSIISLIVALYCVPVMCDRWYRLIAYHVLHLLLTIVLTGLQLFRFGWSLLFSPSDAGVGRGEGRPTRMSWRLPRETVSETAWESETPASWVDRLLRRWCPFIPKHREVDVLLWTYWHERQTVPEMCLADLHRRLQLAKPYRQLTATNPSLRHGNRPSHSWSLFRVHPSASHTSRKEDSNAPKFIAVWRGRSPYTLYPTVSFLLACCFILLSLWCGSLPFYSLLFSGRDEHYVYEYEREILE